MKIGLEHDDIVIDDTPQQQHFNNGYYDQTLNLFKPREFGIDFISKYIKRDYILSTPQQRQCVLAELKKIYPLEQDRDAILFNLGCALTGRAQQEATMLFLLGSGTHGKSFILKLTDMTMECYFKNLCLRC